MAKEKAESSRLLAANVRRLRLAKNLTQAELAERCGFSVNFISELEHAKVWISAQTLDSLSEALSVDTFIFFLPDDERILAQTSVEAAVQAMEQAVNYIRQLKK